MPDITVVRGSADRQGADIVDPLACTIPVQIQRGRNELDAAALADGIRLTCRFLGSAMPGQLIQVADARQGAPWRGKITAVKHSVGIDDAGNIAVTTELDVRRPR